MASGTRDLFITCVSFALVTRIISPVSRPYLAGASALFRCDRKDQGGRIRAGSNFIIAWLGFCTVPLWGAHFSMIFSRLVRKNA